MTIAHRAEINDGTLEEIRVALARRKWSQSDLARQMGVTTMWLSRRMRGETPLTLTDLAAVAIGLELTVVDLLPPHVVLIGPDPAAAATGTHQ